MSRWIWNLLLVLLVLAPLPFGAFRAWAWSLLGVGVAMLAAGWVVALATGRVRLFWRPSLWAPALGVAAVVIWIVVQATWPVSPVLGHPMWGLAAQALGAPVAPRISIAPADGAVALLRLLTAATVFWLVLQLGRERANAEQMMRWLGVSSGLYALYGLVNLIAGNAYLLFYRRWAYTDDVTGTFVNRNSFATFAGLGLLILTTLAADTYRRQFHEADPRLSPVARRQAAMAGGTGAYLFLSLVDAMALLQSHSRMGLLASLVGLGVLLVLLRAIGSVRGWVPIGVTAVLAGLAFFASGAGVTDRIVHGEDGARPALIATTERAIASSPLLGSGYGSFASVFPMYRDASLPDPVVYEMAHSTYLELAMEIGVAAAVVLIAALCWLSATAGLGVVRRRRDRSIPALATAASVLVGVHSLLDFSVQITAVQLLFAALLGVGVAQAFPHDQRRIETAGATGGHRG